MNISVFGLGYVGCVTAACLADDGHRVTGVDINPDKVNLLQQGKSPISEPGLEDLVCRGIQSGHLHVTCDGEQAVQESQLSLVCVGTPSMHNGSLNLCYVESVGRQLGTALRSKRDYHVIVIRSTILPGTVRGKLVPLLNQHSNLQAGEDFGLCFNPEFLREGTAIKDYYHPGYIILGEIDSRSGDVVQQIYKSVDAPVIRTKVETAEMIKYTSNAFHAMKIVFANEIGKISKAHSVDGREVMNIICQDQRLNISPAYLKPGFAFGGSCLPKDVRALTYRARECDVDVPMLSSLAFSNQKQIEHAIDLIEGTGCEKIGILGLSFKAWTDDVRESPAITLIETLVGRGYRLFVFDENVHPEKLVGANKAFLERALPHIACLMQPSMDAVLEQADVIVLANDSPLVYDVPLLLREDQTLIDLVGIAADVREHVRGRYIGICW